MRDPDKPRRIFIDLLHPDEQPPRVDDFIVCIGKLKSNTVYLIGAVHQVRRKDPSARRRFNLSVFVVPFETLLQRDSDQEAWPIRWYPRKRSVKARALPS